MYAVISFSGLERRCAEHGRTNQNHYRKVILENEQIIHASGKVRVDKLDHVGIFNREAGKYTHHLRIIKRVL